MPNVSSCFCHVSGTNSSWRQRFSDFFSCFGFRCPNSKRTPQPKTGAGGTCACQWPVFEAPTVAVPAPRPASSRRSWMRRTRHRRRSRRLVGGSLPKTWKTCWSPALPPFPPQQPLFWGGCYIKKRVFRARSLARRSTLLDPSPQSSPFAVFGVAVFSGRRTSGGFRGRWEVSIFCGDL